MIPTDETLIDMMNLPMLRWNDDEMRPLIELLPDRAWVAEIGSFAGQCSQQFMKSPKVDFLLCVDQWQSGYDAGDRASQTDMRLAERAFDLRMGIHESVRWVKWKASSRLVAQALACKFDLVYIDASHLYVDVLEDIRSWTPRVKRGGWIAGHDYNVGAHPGVKLAVDKIFGEPHHVFGDTSWAVRVE